MTTPKSKRTESTTGEDDAIEMLRAEHRTVEKLFRDFEKCDDPEACRDIVDLACADLRIHTTLEEEVFYPALRAAFGEEDAALIDEAKVEHQSAKQLIERIEGLDTEDPHYAASFTVLAEYVKHHVKDE
jgi:hemerythrin superfamily protein